MTRFVIASEPETAKEILNSSEFADRPIKESAYELLFNRAMGLHPSVITGGTSEGFPQPIFSAREEFPTSEDSAKKLVMNCWEYSTGETILPSKVVGFTRSKEKVQESVGKEMIFRGTDTVAILLEWTLARMVVHPDIQAKAQAEIDSVVGVNRQVADSDLPNLPYLQAILKETLRVHPPGPLLSWARLSIHDTHVGPHFVPAGTTAMVNMYAITHDEKIWSNPNEFKPERFMEEDVPIMGSDLRLAPFGAGRRVCPGKAMGMATAQLWLAQMLQNFRWVPTENGVDLTECLNLSMEMKSSLVCKAVPRISA
uniref:Cytochrome P450 n=1 Tax=Chenopodium quinoa TaxID=63459 RepID=A0A803NEL1_CHEQI